MSGGDAPGDGRPSGGTGVDYASVAEQLEAIERIGHIAYGIYDHQTGRLRLSEGARDLLAVDPRGEFTPADVRQLIHPDDREDARVQFERGIAQGKPFVIEHRMIGGDGRVIWVRRETLKRVGADGSYLGYLGVMQDITEQRRAEDALRARERELSAILDNSPSAIFLKDRDRRFRVLNRRYEEWFGKRAAEMIGRTDREMWPGTIADRIERTDSRVLDGEVVRFEQSATELVPDNADLRHLEVTKFPVRDAAGTIVGICGFVRDITDRKEAEQALHERERELTAILDNAPLAIFLKDRDRRFRVVNRRYQEWSGLRLADMIGRTEREVWGGAIAERIEQTDRRVLGGEVMRTEQPAVNVAPGNPDLRHLELVKFPVRDAAGVIEGICGFVRNITDRKEAEQALHERERELTAILDNAPVAIFLKDRTGRFRLVNRRYEEWFGMRAADLVGRTDRDVYDDAFATLVEASDARVAAGELVSEERPALKFDNRHPGIRHISITKFPIRDAAGVVEGICGFIRDITDRKEAEEARRASEARFRALIEHSSDVICVLEPDGTVRYMSPSAQAILGRDPATRVGRPILEYVVENDRPRLTQILAEVARTPGRRESGEARLQHPDGGIRQIAWTVRNAADVPGIEGLVVNVRDVTERWQLAEQLAQAQKMEAVGQLASGIAHDFNNIIGAILGFAGFLVEDLAPGSETRRFASRIVQAGTRAREVVQQILTFARRTGVERKPQDLRPIVAEAIDLARASLPSSTQISAAIAGAPLVAAVSATQISQILLNLCMNAHDAAGGAPGTIAVTLERVGAADALGAAGNDGAPRARLVEGTIDASSAYARLAVADDGSGMDEAVLRRVFEPFFTTKSRGRGTGLGLPLVHGIVAAHDGVCAIESAPGRGTTIAVLIPLAAADVAANAEPEPAGRIAGHERILVVDDDGDIVDMVTTGLDRLGYEAVGIGDAAEALAVYRADPAAWDVVISDQVMPHIKGLQLLAEMRAVNPGQRFILCTGFSDSASEQVAREAGVDGYFMKPVPIGQLAAAIRALCDGNMGDEA